MLNALITVTDKDTNAPVAIDLDRIIAIDTRPEGARILVDGGTKNYIVDTTNSWAEIVQKVSQALVALGRVQVTA